MANNAEPRKFALRYIEREPADLEECDSSNYGSATHIYDKNKWIIIDETTRGYTMEQLWKSYGSKLRRPSS